MSLLFNQLSDIKVGLLGNFQFVDSQRTHCDNFGGKPIIFLANPTKQERNGFNGNTITLTPDILFDNSLALSSFLPYNASLWTITLVRGKGSMATLFKESSAIRTILCADILDANTETVNHLEEANDYDDDNDGSSLTTSTVML